MGLSTFGNLNSQMLPSPNRPLLIGLLVDVSASMVTPIYGAYEEVQNRLESLRASFGELVSKASGISQEGVGGVLGPLAKIFAYGFGFGNPLAAFFGDKGEKVRDLLELSGGTGSSTVGVDELSRNWTLYRDHITQLVSKMFGDTPLVGAFQTAQDRFESETGSREYTSPPILFVLSDGEPTDGSPEKVLEIADQIKEAGVLIISCYVTSQDITDLRRLYRSPLPDWPSGAALMCSCASELPAASPFLMYLKEYGWQAEPGVRLFAQINHSEILTEFLNLVISPLAQPVQAGTPERVTEASVAEQKTASDTIPSQQQLRDVLVKRFNEQELRDLCFDLHLDYESLPGDGYAAKARELVAYLERRDRLAELVEAVSRLRPSAFSQA